jgi:arginase family enzyme
MQVEVLHCDSGLSAQSQFLAEARSAGAREADLREAAARVRLWGRNGDLAAVARAFPPLTEARRVLTFYGSGDFHHVSALLVERAANAHAEPFTVIHFDNHPDWVHFSNGMHCGSWVNRALAVPQVAKVITIGVCSSDLENPHRKGANLEPLRNGRVEMYVYDHAPSKVKGRFEDTPAHRHEDGHLVWTGIGETGVEAFTETLLTRIGTDAVYITLDKDALATDDAITNWDQGQLRLADVEAIIRAVAGRHRIIGADVTGDYSPIQYAGKPWSIVWKRAESLIDQPRVKHTAEKIASLNGKTNARLLKTFTEVMA